MPELPEVETVRRDLNERLIGQRFLKVDVYDFKNVAPSAIFLAKNLLGLKIKEISRRGKLLIFNFYKSDLKLLIHLKMTGQLIYKDKQSLLAGGHSLSKTSLNDSIGGDLPNRFTRVVFTLSLSKLFFNDLRKFAYIKLLKNKELERILKISYGPEPLDKEFNDKFLVALLKRHKTSIKALLLKQEVIAGLGNIYVDESLFLAQIKPDRLANSISESEAKKLRIAIVKIIKKAIEKRGTTFSDYLDGEGKVGNFSDYLKVFNRQKKSCYKCKNKIKKIRVAGRGTHFCPKCQR
jgi:formamidopyrimidine-DNA glycosylase